MNVADKEGMTPLHLAVVNDDRGVFSHLLERGADPNRPDERGWTPLHWAAYNDSKIAVQLLLDKQADPARPDNKGRLPIQVVSCNPYSPGVTLSLLDPSIPPYGDLMSTDPRRKPKKVENLDQRESKDARDSSNISCLNPPPPTKRKKNKKTKGKADVSSDQDPKSNSPSEEQKENAPASDTASNPEKRLRNLKKKLRLSKDLEAKIKSGEVTNPDPDQREKVSRIAHLEEEVAALENEVAIYICLSI